MKATTMTSRELLSIDCEQFKFKEWIIIYQHRKIHVVQLIGNKEIQTEKSK